jgi:hypothetical protein
VRWIASDGRLRTDEELLLETARVLGFDRVGKRIREWLEEAVEGYRRATARGAP